MRDGLQRTWCSRCLSIPKIPPLEALKLCFHHHHYNHYHNHQSLPIGNTSRLLKVPRGSHYLCPWYSHSFSSSLSGFLLVFINTILFSINCSKHPWVLPFCFLLGQFWLLAQNFQWLKFFWELIKATRNRLCLLWV